ncbi:hypothetical protein SAMN05216390_11426 [Lachnospiraceae bacterium KH1T2]|nr:hypothetical protein SAMN05216390_11426 [Lachnospiraceae bacterium KH1T2]
MIIKLNEEEIKLLKKAEIEFDPTKDYSEDEALELADMVFDQEIEYSNYPSSNKKAVKLAVDYSELYDKLQNLLS